MRVGVVGPSGPDDFADNIASSLTRMGHDVSVLGSIYPQARSKASKLAVDLARKATPVDLRVQRLIVKRAEGRQLDLIVTVESLDPSIVAALQQVAGRVVHWFPDAVSNLGRHLMFLAPYDGVFFKQPRLVERSQRLLGANVHYLPEACNPEWHKPPEDDGERSPFIVVAGNFYPYRVRLLERLLDEGIPLKLFGAGWPRWLRAPRLRAVFEGRYIARHEKAREFRNAAAVLNTLHPGEVDGYNVRLFEAAGCGATVITEARPELESFFDVENELLVYSDFEELVDRCRFALEHPDQGRKLGDAAAARAHAEHTYDHRLRTMFDLVRIDTSDA